MNNEIKRIDLDFKMKEYEKRFNFIKCLGKDKNEFIKEYLLVLNYDKKEYKYYNIGAIKISTWVSIMNKLNLNNYYFVYRNSYSGENTNLCKNEIQYPSYKTCLIEFGKFQTNTINLYISNKTMKRIYLFRRSNYINKEQWFWDEIMA